MKVRMLSTQDGSESRPTCKTYEAGVEYDLSHSAGARDLAAVFLREGWAEPVDETALGLIVENPPSSAEPDHASTSPAGTDADASAAAVDNRPTADPREQQAAVEIPAGWRSLKWNAMKALAAKVSNDPIEAKADAIAAIEAELARRQG